VQAVQLQECPEEWLVAWALSSVLVVELVSSVLEVEHNSVPVVAQVDFLMEVWEQVVLEHLVHQLNPRPNPLLEAWEVLLELRSKHLLVVLHLGKQARWEESVVAAPNLELEVELSLVLVLVASCLDRVASQLVVWAVVIQMTRMPMWTLTSQK
jgi:hypothetical protein